MLTGTLVTCLALGGLALGGLGQGSAIDDRLAAAARMAESGQIAEARAAVAAMLLPDGAGGAERARILMALASLDNRLGDYDAARRHAGEAATVYIAIGDRRGAGNARSLSGSAHVNAGAYTEAATAFGEALGDARAAGDAAGEGEQLTNLGNVAFFLGRYDEATRSYAEAMQVVEAHGAEAWATRRRSLVLANQAALEQRLGRYDAALTVYRTMGESRASVRPEEQAQMLVNQGALFRRLGDPYKALDAYDDARRRFADHAHVSGELAALTNRGIVLALDLGRAEEAVSVFGQALSLAERTDSRREALLARLYRGEAALGAGRVAEATADFEAGRVLADSMAAAEEQWKAWYGLGRAAAAAGDPANAVARLDRAIAIVETIRDGLTLPSRRADFFQDKRDVYDARIALSLTSEPVAQTFALVERSRARAWRDRLGLEGDVTLAAVQAVLPSDTVVLSYWYSALGAAVIRVTRDSAAMTPVRVESQTLTRWLAALERPDTAPEPAVADLAATLIPVGSLAGVRRLVVVPDGPLGLVPFEALPVDAIPLVSRLSVRYVPTAAALLTPRPPRRRWRGPWSAGLAAFGDPLPGRDPWVSSAAATRLPASAGEVRAAATALGGRHQLFLGADNVKDRLAGALAAHPFVLHVATHGIADPVNAERSRLLFSPPKADGPREALFLREIYDLPLDGLELAVFSACETERGPVLRGEGVQGFGRALLAAGAQSSITSLWRVSDAAAAALMHEFYERLQQGVDRAEALAAAKRAVMARPSFAHPHHWAAFVLTGDDGPLPRTPRWSTIAGGALIGLSAVLAGVALRRRRAPAHRV
jgi:CHAT domain-containing protein/tetratricopeptide (TPR) repeat protein